MRGSAEENLTLREEFEVPIITEYYFQSAFARSESLIKPDEHLMVGLFCSEGTKAKCEDFKTKLSLYFPVPITIEEDWNSRNKPLLELYLYENEAERVRAPLQLYSWEKMQKAVYDDKKCGVAQFIYGPRVMKVIVITVLSNGENLSQACFVKEAARGLGISFRQKYSDYSPFVEKMGPDQFQNSMKYFRRLIELQMSSKTRSGMTKAEVQELLEN